MARGACKVTSLNGALTVTFTAASGATPTVYSDEALTTTVSLPATVASGTSSTFNFASPGSYTLSVKDSAGVEIAGDLNSTRTITVFTGETAVLAYDTRRVAKDPAGDTGRFQATGEPAALTGVTAPTRFVGGTTSGSPLSGTFSVGDLATDQTGLVWICTAAGTPGTWKSLGASELAYAEITSNSAGVTSATPTAITGLSIAPTCPGSAIILDVNGTVLRTASTADTLCFFSVYENSTAGTLIAKQSFMVRNATNETARIAIRLRFTPTAGSHTYIGALTTSATTTLLCIGNAQEPFSISARNV